MAAILNTVFYVEAKTTSDDFSIGDLYKVNTSTLTDADGISKQQSSVTTGNRGGFVSDEIEFLYVIADKAVTYNWYGASAADSSTVSVVANEPFIFPTGTTLPYAATLAARVAGTAVDIGSGSLQVYNGSGTTATVRAYAVTVDDE